MTERSDDRTWIAPAAWAAVTAVLIVVTLTLDPLWSYYGSWAAGFITAFSVVRRARRQDERRRLVAEEEALLSEVRQAKTAAGNDRLPSGLDPKRKGLSAGGDAREDP